jgi:hypothetical protein
LPFTAIFPNPDGTLDACDRSQISMIYCVEAGSPPDPELSSGDIFLIGYNGRFGWLIGENIV